MKYFNINDFEIEVEAEVTSDGQILGNIADFDDFRKMNEDEILEKLELSFPWGEVLYLEEYLDFLNQQIFLEYPELLLENESDLGNLPVINTQKNVFDLEVAFPERDDLGMDSIVNEIFDLCKVPKGTQYEESLPLELQFWNKLNYVYNDYELYRALPISILDHKKEIESIHSKVKENNDPLVKKSLILSAMSMSESLLKSLIVSQTPDINETHPFIQEIFNENFNKKLRGTYDDLRGLFNKLYSETAPKMDWIPLRNSLAHDIENTMIFNNEIRYKVLKSKKTESISIDTLFEKLTKFNVELTKIMN